MHFGIVVHDEHTVGAAPHVELDAVGTELTGPRMNAATVFSGATAEAPR